LSISNYLKGKSFRTGIIFTSGNFVVAVAGAVSALLYGRWIEPGILGEFNKYGILTGYLGFGIIFVDAAFQRHFPYFLGKSDTDKAKKIAATAKWWYMSLVWAGVIIFGSLAIKAAVNSDTNAVLGWIAQIPIYAVATYGLYLRILYRSNEDFLKLNKNMLITAGAGLIALPLVYFFKYSGLAARAIIQNSVNTIVHVKNAPYKIKARFHKQGLLELAKVSLPLQIPVYLDSHLLKATISLVILNTLGERSLGVYAMAVMMQSFLMVFSRSLNQIVTTKLMLKYGSNDSLKKTFQYIFKPILLLTAIGLVIVVAFNTAIQPTINYFMPKYAASIVVVQILAFDMVLALIRSPFSLFISSLMYKEMVVIRVLKLVFTLILMAFFHSTLVQIASIIILANFLNVIAGYILLYSKMVQPAG
jgi:hypothetical protein